MNEKTNEFHRIVAIVVECCKMENQDREELKQKVVGNSREEHIIIMRCMLARLLAFAGFTNTSIGIVLHKTPQSVRHLLDLARDLRNHNRMYRLAEDQSFREYQREEEE
ncbi:MAG: hypothetical protein KBT03_09875 [Bacteroidales bacterium]|nr:hypothetical protein [Candidatus Scybalousia scybalohippi]